MDSSTIIEIHYATSGEILTEVCYYTAEKGSLYAVIDMPYREYTHIRVDINIRFSLEDIFISQGSVTPKYEKRLPNIHQAIALYMILFLAGILFDKSTGIPDFAVSGTCFLFALLEIGMLIYENTEEQHLTVNREAYWMITGLLMVFIYLTVYKRPFLICAFIVFLGAIWLVFDLKYSIYDEYAHFSLVNHIIETGEFPLVQENYEAVQGPIYYYAMAILLGILPQEVLFITCRFVGLVCLITFAILSWRLIQKLEQHNLIHVDAGLKNVIWILLIFNPHILIRLTRVSNECFAVLFSGLIIYLIADQIIEGFDKRRITIGTIFCAAAFLTKATTMFLFCGLLIVCAYYKQWKSACLNTALLIGLISPWFLSNYITYGALTAMEGHVEYMLTRIPAARPDILGTILNLFHSYFYNEEIGQWFFSDQVSQFLSIFCLLLVCSSAVYMCKIIAYYAKERFRFKYNLGESKIVITCTFTMLLVACMGMHVVTSLSTYINSLGINRYYFILNGSFCCLLLIGLSNVKPHTQKYITGMITFVVSVLTTSMIFGYLNIILQQ